MWQGAISCTNGSLTLHWPVLPEFGATLNWTYFPCISPFVILAMPENQISRGRGQPDI